MKIVGLFLALVVISVNGQQSQSSSQSGPFGGITTSSFNPGFGGMPQTFVNSWPAGGGGYGYPGLGMMGMGNPWMGGGGGFGQGMFQGMPGMFQGMGQGMW